MSVFGLCRVKVSKEFQQMLDAVEKEEEEQGGHGLVTEDEADERKRERRHTQDSGDGDGFQELLRETSEVTHGVDLGGDAASNSTKDDGEMESMIQGLVKSMNDTFPSGTVGMFGHDDDADDWHEFEISP